MITTVSSIIDAPIEEVWRLLDFPSWGAWLQGDTLTMEDGADQGPVGSVRVVSMGDRPGVREKLLLKDDARHTMTYTFDGPTSFPVRRYVSTVRLDPITTSGATFVHWSAEMDADAADEQMLDSTIGGVYLSFIEAIRAKVTASTS